MRRSRNCHGSDFKGALKGDEPKGTNANLRFSASSCGFLRCPAKISGFLRKSAFPKRLVFYKNQRKSTRICVWAQFVPLGWSPYRLLRNAYISNSKTLKSVSASASVTVINSQTIKVCICNPENREITDLVTDIPNGLLGFGWGSGNNWELHICNR